MIPTGADADFNWRRQGASDHCGEFGLQIDLLATLKPQCAFSGLLSVSDSIMLHGIHRGPRRILPRAPKPVGMVSQTTLITRRRGGNRSNYSPGGLGVISENSTSMNRIG